MNLTVFLDHLKEAASSPFAFVAYICVVASWVYAATSRHRLNVTAGIIKDLPEAQKIEVIKRTFNATPRSGLSAEQWIRARLHMLLFLAFLAVLVTFIAIAGFALSRSSTAEIEPLKDPVDVTNPGTTSSTEPSGESLRSEPLLSLKPKLSNSTLSSLSVSHRQPELAIISDTGASNEPSEQRSNSGLGLVQILEERNNAIENQRIFDVILENKSKALKLLTKFEVKWSYISGGGAGGERAYALEPIEKYAIELPIEVGHPTGSKTQYLSRPLVVPPGSENEPNLVSLRLNVFYRLVDERNHPYTNWDIIFTVAILDKADNRTVIFSERRWKDRPQRRGVEPEI